MVMEASIILMGIGQIFLRILFWPFDWWCERTSPQRIPKNEDPILRMSAKKLAKKIRTGQLKSEDVVRCYIKRIREVNPVLNAVVDERYDSAIEDAKNVDKEIASGNRKPDDIEKHQPLLGVPITVKESCSIKGMSQCVGTKSRMGLKAGADGKAVALIKASGAIPLAVTTTPELCLSWETINLVTGKTMNPYNTHRTSGGSSGGEGALLGAGASVAGLGSDIAGSIRVPAHFNGIFGHKPTGGIVSVEGHYPNSTDKLFPEYLVIGPMTRYAEDLKIFLEIIAGENAKKLNLSEPVNLSDLKVFYMHDRPQKIYDVPIQPEIQDGILKCVKYLGDKGAYISNERFQEFCDSVELSVSVFFSTLHDIPNLLKNPENPKENVSLFLETVKFFLGFPNYSLHTLMFYLLQNTNAFIPRSKSPLYQKLCEDFKNKLQNALGKNGVLLYPTFPISAFHHYKTVCYTAGVSYTMLFNIMKFPSTHVPLGFDKNNLPIGIQVVANCNQDRLCIAVAEELEKAFGGWIPPPHA